MAAYNVSKAATLSLSETLAAELIGTPIHVTALCPTFVKTNIVNAGRITAGSVGFGGTDLLALPERAMAELRGREMSMVFQNPRAALNPIRAVGRQIADVLVRHGGATRAQAPAPVTAQRSSHHDVSLAELFADFTSSDKRFDARRLPREVWLAGLSVCVGLLAGLLWWLGARGHDAPVAYAVPRRTSHSRIDWSQVDEGSRGSFADEGFADEEPARGAASRRESRAAA